MPDSNDTVDAARKLLEDRRQELHAELKNLEQAISALGGEIVNRVETATRRGPGRPRGTTKKAAAAKPAAATTGTRRRRRRKGGTRSEQSVKLITEKPGLSASEIATELGIKPNYMYRVLSELEAEGKIRKDGRKYLPAS